nr:MAG TPA: hypothetical protein [Bacteriophage sp.]
MFRCYLNTSKTSYPHTPSPTITAGEGVYHGDMENRLWSVCNFCMLLKQLLKHFVKC